jgi:hypothetical protein
VKRFCLMCSLVPSAVKSVLLHVHNDPRSLGLPETQSRVAEADFERVAERGRREEFDGFAFKQAEFGEALHESRRTGDGQHFRSLAGFQVVQSGHRSTIATNGPDENLRAIRAAKTKAAIRDLQQAGRAGLNDAESFAFAEAEFRQPTDPRRIAGDIGHLAELARLQHV